MANKFKPKKVLLKKIKITGTGKIMRSHQLRAGHLKRKKSKSTLRTHKQEVLVSKTIEKTVRKLIGV